MNIYFKIFLVIRYIIYGFLVLLFSSCVKYEVETFTVDDDIYRYNLYSNYENTFFYFDFDKYPYKDTWVLVDGYITIEMDSLAWGETFDTIYLNQNKQAIFINTYLVIDTAYLGLLWDLDDGDIVANGETYNYNFLNYSNIIDVNTTPSKRTYQIIYIDDNDMVIKTPKQYVDDNGALQTREAILEFERIN